MGRLISYAIAVLPAISMAASQGHAPGFQADPVEVWGSRFLITGISIGIGVLLFSMVKYRGQTTGALSWALLIAGVGVVPAASTGLGSLLVLTRAERVEFCASCHGTMKPFADDMRDPKSKSLAAVHFKNKYIPENQCYVCHRAYGMFGTIEAKVSGMVNVYKYYSGTFHTPVKMRTAYPNRDCLKCHGESARWLQQDQHAKNQADLVSDRVRCLECHESDHPAHALGEKGAQKQ